MTLPTFDSGLGNETVTLILKNNIGRLSKGVQYHKSCVVSGVLVLTPGVSQSTNQIFIQLSNLID